MYCETLPSGKVRYIETYKDPLTLKIKRVSISMEKDSKANQKLATELLQDKIKQKLSCNNPKKQYTFKEIVDAYVTQLETEVKPSTYTRNKNTLYKCSEIIGNDVYVDQINALYIKERFKNYKNSTANEFFKRIKAMLRWAYTNDLIANRNICDKLTNYKVDKDRDKLNNKYLEPDELQLILEKFKSKNMMLYYYLTHFLALTGLRIGEAIALKTCNVNEDYIYVVDNYDIVNEIFQTTKTDASTRNVYIYPELKKIIKEYMAYRKKICDENNISSEFFFIGSAGNHVRYYSYYQVLKYNAVAAGLSKKITPHILRHTHASLLAAKDVPLDVIMRRLGHEDSEITKRIYIHITKERVRKDNAIMDGITLL